MIVILICNRLIKKNLSFARNKSLPCEGEYSLRENSAEVAKIFDF